MLGKTLNPIELAVFSSRLSAICEEMGLVLQKTSFSPNIKDRLDYSCAFFDEAGKIIAQAAHIPVHLGSMAYAMSNIVDSTAWYEGDMLILNDPFKGGTHLPDVTLVSPVYHQLELIGFFACRAHHANIGCDQPGSMPLSKTLEDEGVVIPPMKLYEGGQLQEEVAKILFDIEGEELSEGLPGDFSAQVSCLDIGLVRMNELISKSHLTVKDFRCCLGLLNDYGKMLALKSLADLPKGCAHFEDYLDNDGFSEERVKIALDVVVDNDGIKMDFAGSSPQVSGNLNCPISVCAASAYYVFACLLPDYVPHCDGVFSLISINVPEGSVLNARPGAAVAAGNVETSMRVVDVVLGAMSELGLELPAASQGTMNNVAMGAESWNYYETIGGGMGASKFETGLSGVQCHMTNSLNTPVESLEMHYPLQIKRYALRSGSGGKGTRKGGEGLERVYVFNQAAKVTLLTDRRVTAPWGLNGGGNGSVGVNLHNETVLSGKVSINLEVGDELSISTPGGGGFGSTY